MPLSPILSLIPLPLCLMGITKINDLVTYDTILLHRDNR